MCGFLTGGVLAQLGVGNAGDILPLHASCNAVYFCCGVCCILHNTIAFFNAMKMFAFSVCRSPRQAHHPGAAAAVSPPPATAA
jgi:hypothetical protein